MSKFCKYCKTENPNDFIACKNCGKILPKSDGIKTGKKTTFSIFAILTLIIIFISIKIYDKNAYQVVNFPDKYTNLDVLTFKLPAKWIPIGKVTYNPKSIPNMYTYFIAAVNPKNNVNMQFFSTQFETDNGIEFEKTEKTTKINSEEYFRFIIKKLSPHAKNIKFIKRIAADKKDIKQSIIDKYIFNSIYQELNPKTPKGKCWIDDYENIPIKYLYSFEENGKTIYQLIEGRFVSFTQSFANSPEDNAKIKTSIKYIKCENVFSYQAEEKYYKKYMNKYLVFKNNIKHNKTWEEYTGLQRRNKLAEISFMTTKSLVGGDKFNKEKFKNTVYYIEYPESYTLKKIQKDYKKTLKRLTKNI